MTVNVGEMESLTGRNMVYVNEEYATQFHGLSITTVHDHVLLTLKETIDEALDTTWTCVGKVCPGHDFKSAQSVLRKIYEGAVLKHSPGILEVIQKALYIPPNVLLPEDAVQERQYSEEEVGSIQKKNLELKKQALYNSKLKILLLAELDILEYVEVLERKVSEWETLCKQFRSESENLKKNLQEIDILFGTLQTSDSFVARKCNKIKISLLEKIGKG